MENTQQSFHDEVKDSSKKEWPGLVIIAIIGIIIGLGAGYLVFQKDYLKLNNANLPLEDGPTLEGGTNTPTGTIASSTSPIGLISVRVDDQEPNTRVKISSLTLPEGAWVVTFTSTEDKSRPERIIGAQYFATGTYTDENGYIAEGTVAGETYFVALYRDDNVKGAATPGGHIFNSVTDRPILVNGNWVMDSFLVTTTGSRG